MSRDFNKMAADLLRDVPRFTRVADIPAFTRAGVACVNNAIKAVAGALAELAEGKDREIDALARRLQQRDEICAALEIKISALIAEINKQQAAVREAESRNRERFIAGLRAAKSELLAVGFTGHAVDVVEAKIKFEEAKANR